ncbi:hypothetical protein KNO81_41920 [Paraburkholderia sediminicola]|nr:hypothetical protein [Paraburkholderia sediminicola]
MAHCHRLSVRLGDEVRAEAKRRCGAWAGIADECATRAEKMYDRRPLHGVELRIVFDDVSGPNGSGINWANSAGL